MGLGLGLGLDKPKGLIYFQNQFSMEFDGSDDKIFTDADAVAQNSTYSFWCKSSETGENKGVFGHGGDNKGAFHFNWSDSGITRPLLYLGNNFYIRFTDIPAQDDNKWHHWVVYLATNLVDSKLYCDGVLQAKTETISSGSLEPYTQSLTIGAESDSQTANCFLGSMDEFAVFDRELTQAEITRMYNTYYTNNIVKNGSFEEIGDEEVTNGDFSQIGSELIVNGDFASDTWWQKSSANVNISNGKGNFTAGTTEYFYKTNTLEIGKTYKLVFEITDYTTGYISAFGGNWSVAQSAARTYEIYFKCVDTTFGLVGNTFIGSIDNVSVKEVGQDWSFNGESELTSQGARIYSSAGANSYIQQSSVFTINKHYKFNYTIVNSTQGSLKLTSVNGGDLTINSNVGPHTVFITANNAALSILRNSGVTDVTITNISIKEVGQHWTFGTGWSTDSTKATSDGTQSVSYLRQNGIVNLTSTYKVQFTVSGSSSGTLNLLKGNASTAINVTSDNTYTFNTTWDGSSGDIVFQSLNFVGSVDNIVVQELKHQATNLLVNSGDYQSANPLLTSTKSMNFDGIDDYLVSESPTIGTEFTVSAWINTSDVSGSGGSYAAFFATGGYNGGATFKIGIRSDNGKIEIWQGGSARGTGTSNVADGKWHLINYTKNSTQAKIYVDGVLERTTAYTTTLTFPYIYVGLGGNNSPIPDNGGYFAGLVTELGLYDRTLTSLEVASLYNQGMPTNLLVNRNNYQSGNPTVFNTKQVDFDGIDDYLNVDTLAGKIITSQALTISVWFKSNSNATGAGENILFSAHTTGNSNVYRLGVSPLNSGGIFYGADSVVSNTVVGSTVYNDNKWHQLIVTKPTGASLTTFYVDGASIGTIASTNALWDNAVKYSIGQEYDASPSDFFTGQISQLGIFNSTLTADEVSSLYNHGLPIDLKTDQAAYTSSSNLVGYWRMGDGTLDTYPLIADQTNATLSAEYVVNGDFSNGTTGWIAPAQDGAYQQLTADGLKMYAGTSQGASNLLSSTTTFNLSGTEGKVYKADIVSSDFVVGSTMYLRLDGVYDANNIISFLTGTQTVYFTAYRDFTFIRFFAGSFEQGFTLKSISIKEVGGNPAMMSNTFAATAIENGSPYANLVQNGDFSEGTTDWTSGAAVTSFTVTNSIATVLGTSSSAQNKITQSIPVTTGNTYKISGSIRSNDGKDYRVRILDSAYVDIKNNNNSSFETFEYERVAQSSFITLIFESWYSDGTTNFSVDYATLEEVNTGLQGYWKMGDGTNDEYPVIYDQTNPTIGSELVVNGTFLTNTTTGWNDWDNLTNPSNTSQQDGYGILDATTGTCDARQQPTVTPGKTYKIEATIKEDAGANAKLYMSDGANYSYAFGNFQATTTETTFVKYVVPTQTVIRLYAYNSGSAKAYFKNISVKEIGGNPATMIAMPEGNITNQFPLTKIRNYYRMGDGILDSKFLSYPATAAPFIFQDQTSPNLAHIPTTNLLSNSNVFVANSATLTPNYGISPDGTQNSTRVETSGNNSGVRISISNSSNNDFAYSVFVKGVSGETVNVRVETSPYSLLIQYNFTFNGEWQRVENVLTASNTHTQKNFYVTHLGGSTATDFQVYGIQIEEQSQATPYLKSDGIAAVRKSSTTNLITYSEDTSQSLWTDNHITWSHNLYPSPIGTNNATKITSTNNGAKVVVSLNLENSKTYTVSMYIKNISTTSVKMLVYQNNDAAIPLNSNYQDELSTTEWVRVKKTFTTTSSAAGNTVQIQPVRDLNSGGEMYIWGLQVEQQTQAETYAPTKGIPVTIDLFTENNYGATQGGIIQKDVPRNS